MQYLLGIDNGGTMTKAALFTADGAEVASASRETPVETPQTGYYERDMDALWETTAACIREALGRADIDGAAVMGVGCTGHGKGLYLWGRDGCPAAKAVASTDKRALSIVSDWEESHRPPPLGPCSRSRPVSRRLCWHGFSKIAPLFWRIPAGYLRRRIIFGSD